MIGVVAGGYPRCEGSILYIEKTIDYMFMRVHQNRGVFGFVCNAWHSESQAINFLSLIREDKSRFIVRSQTDQQTLLNTMALTAQTKMSLTQRSTFAVKVQRQSAIKPRVAHTRLVTKALSDPNLIIGGMKTNKKTSTQ